MTMKKQVLKYILFQYLHFLYFFLLMVNRKSSSLKPELKYVVMIQLDKERRSKTIDISFLFVLRPILNSY